MLYEITRSRVCLLYLCYQLGRRYLSQKALQCVLFTYSTHTHTYTQCIIFHHVHAPSAQPQAQSHDHFSIFCVNGLTPTLFLSRPTISTASNTNKKHLHLNALNCLFKNPYTLMNSISSLPSCTFFCLWLVCGVFSRWPSMQKSDILRADKNCLAKPRGNVIRELTTLFNRVLRCKIMGRKENTA